ncbi:MAG: hypothetical protein JXB07_19140 [Anaerolineae bacterium]|nr:hypothetical protein [Anaerolineae bacterium]
MDDLFSVTICGMPVIVLLMIAVMMAVPILISYRQRQVTIERWDHLAKRTGLTLERGSWLVKPCISGEYRRHPIELTTYTRSHGKSSTTYTLITLIVANDGKMLKISPSGALREAIGKAFGMQDVQIGFEEFDRHFTIQSQPPEFAVEILSGDVMLREDIAGLKSSGWFELALDGQKLTYREIGRETNPDRLETMFNTLASLADKIDNRGKGRF